MPLHAASQVDSIFELLILRSRSYAKRTYLRHCPTANQWFLHSVQQYAFSNAGQPMSVYGDLAYPPRVHLQAPFRHSVLTAQMEAYNASMSAVRSSMEWLFGDIVNYFKSLDFIKNLKIGLSSVGKMYIVSALLQNAHTPVFMVIKPLLFLTLTHQHWKNILSNIPLLWKQIQFREHQIK